MVERIQSINRERIKWCCADRGISLSDLASEVDISQMTLNALMAGESGITYGQLRKIATYFGQGVLFFLDEAPVDEGAVHTPQFRTLASHKPDLSARLKSLIEQVERQRNVYLSLKEDLDGADLPVFSPPKLKGFKPKVAAEHARAWLRLGDTVPTFDKYRSAIEAKGVLVFRSNGYNGKWQIAKESPVLGFALYDEQCPVVVVKKLESEARQTFTLIHELGHLLVHEDSSIDDDKDLHALSGREREANAFAGFFLVPDERLSQVRDADRPVEVSSYDEWLKPVRRASGASGEVILRRLLDVGRLDESQYQAYRQWRANLPVSSDNRGSRTYRHREPKHLFGDVFVRTVLDALSARHITLARASDYLDSLKVKDIRALERHYAGV